MTLDHDDDPTTPFARGEVPLTAAEPHPYPTPGMFGSFGTRRRMPRWTGPLLSAIVLGHVVVFATMWATSIWDLEGLDRPKMKVALAVAPQPPPPPPPLAGGEKPAPLDVPKRPTADKPYQLEEKGPAQPPQVATSTTGPGDLDGPKDGTPGGVVGGVPDNKATSEPAPVVQPRQPPKDPIFVPTTVFEGSRVAGESTNQVKGSFKLCIDISGTVVSVKTLQSTAYPAYDQRIMHTIRTQWRYRPYQLNGAAVPVCTVVTFLYSQR
jgi:hypothetical protein